MPLWYHIAFGSRANLKTRFISCTKNIGVAQKYALDEKRFDTIPKPIVLINLEKLKEYGIKIYDTLDTDIIKQEQLAEKPSSNYAPGSQEVVIEKIIPNDCIARIPTLFVDIIRALETCKVDYKSGLYDKQYSTVIQCINELIMSNDLSILNLIDGNSLSKLENEFIKNYYFGEGKSLSQISQEMFNGDINLTGCIKIQLLKNIVGSPDFKKGIATYIMKHQKRLLEGYGEDDISKLGAFVNKSNDFNPIETYIDAFDDVISVTANHQYRKAYNQEDKDFLIIGDSVAIYTQAHETKRLPYSATIKEAENGTFHVDTVFAQAEKDEFGKTKIKMSESNIDNYALTKPREHLVVLNKPTIDSKNKIEDYII